MVDLVITSTDVLRSNGSERNAIAGVAITAGESVYVDTAGLVQLCEKDQTAVEAAAVGIALNDAGIGQPVSYQVSGVVDLGTVLTVGEVYCVGAAPGGIAPTADIVSTEYQTTLGIATTTALLQIGINQSGVASS